MKLRKIKNRFLDTLILFLGSIILLPLVITIFVLYLIFGIFEYIVYKKKYNYLSNYYPLILHFERYTIKFKNILDKNKIPYTYDKDRKVFIINNNSDIKKVVYFKYSNLKDFQMNKDYLFEDYKNKLNNFEDLYF